MEVGEAQDENGRRAARRPAAQKTGGLLLLLEIGGEGKRSQWEIGCLSERILCWKGFLMLPPSK